MMIGNKENLFYRFVNNWSPMIPSNSLCVFGRQVFYTTLWLIFMAACIGTGFAFVTAPLVQFILSPEWHEHFYPIAFVGGVIDVIILTTFLTDSIDERRLKLPLKEKVVVKEPSLFVEYCKAIHAKVCPIIVWKE